MKSFRLYRALTGVFLMISWFIATNHCALGLMRPTVQAEAEHSHCHAGKTVPGKNLPSDGLRECCRTLQAAPVPEKAEVKFDASKFQLPHFALLQVLAPQKTARALPSFVLDHGPPRAVSFAESVLQRSLLCHAPPFAV